MDSSDSLLIVSPLLGSSSHAAAGPASLFSSLPLSGQKFKG